MNDKLETFEPGKIAALNEATQRSFQVLEAQNQSLQDAVAQTSARNYELGQQIAQLEDELPRIKTDTRKLVKDELGEHHARMEAMLQSYPHSATATTSRKGAR